MGIAPPRVTLGDAWVAGVRARQQGLPRGSRPDFGGRDALMNEWEAGWRDGEVPPAAGGTSLA